MMPRPAPAYCVNGHPYDNYLSKCPKCGASHSMQGFTFNAEAGIGSQVSVQEDVNNGFALVSERFAVSLSFEDSIRLRNWLNLKYPS